MFASAQIDTGVHASLPVWPPPGYHWSGILHVPNFLLHHRRTTHRLPNCQRKTNAVTATSFTLQTWALTVGTLCVFTPALSPPTR
jgi:hypothetical protein